MADATRKLPGGSARAGEPRWEHFHHEADTGIRGTGPRPDRAFEQAALAMMAVMSDPRTIESFKTIRIHCTAPNLELLLLDWLNAIIFEMATRKMLFRTFRVRIEGHALSGMARGEAINTAKHRPAVEVKGATMSELRVTETAPGAWIAQCIVDV